MKGIIERLDTFGRGITYCNNKITFVEGAFPLEEVEFEITDEKSKYNEAILSKVIKPSPYRISSKCKYSKDCGGCIFQELDYLEENKEKENKIRELVKRNLPVDESIVKKIIFSNEDSYRNKIVLHGNGLYSVKSHNTVEIEECLLCNFKINEIIKLLKEENIEECLIRTSNDYKEVIVDCIGKINNPELMNLCDVLIVNHEYQTKKHSIHTNIGDKIYRLSSDSFFQVNIDLTKALYDKVKEGVERIKPNSILDLYCGTGSIGIYVSDKTNKLVGIDYNESNIKDAKENAKMNDINNTEFICDKVENKIEEFKDFDLVIVDPPRKGLDEKTRNHLLKMNPNHIIYVSCDPVTLVRDLKDFIKNYNIKEIQPFNMFPRTHHCESVCILERK